MKYMPVYGTAQLQGNEDSRVACKLFASCTRFTRVLHLSHSRFVFEMISFSIPTLVIRYGKVQL